jgi:hypothetical protein
MKDRATVAIASALAAAASLSMAKLPGGSNLGGGFPRKGSNQPVSRPLEYAIERLRAAPRDAKPCDLTCGAHARTVLGCCCDCDAGSECLYAGNSKGWTGLRLAGGMENPFEQA